MSGTLIERPSKAAALATLWVLPSPVLSSYSATRDEARASPAPPIAMPSESFNMIANLRCFPSRRYNVPPSASQIDFASFRILSNSRSKSFSADSATPIGRMRRIKSSASLCAPFASSAHARARSRNDRFSSHTRSRALSAAGVAGRVR